jgi:hypothetical protein
MGGGATLVYYLDEHGPAGVVRGWLEATPRYVDAAPYRGSIRRAGAHGESFREGAREVASDYFEPPETPDTSGERDRKTCPFCGVSVKGLPVHLEGGCPND